MKARLRIRENIELVVKNSAGEIKKQFQPNKIATFFLKRGVVMAQIPFLFGNWSDSLKISNLITNTGAAGVASRINGADSEAAFTYIAVGTGTTAADVTDTTLEAEIADSGLSRAAATASRTTTDVTNDTSRLQKTFSVTGTKAVTEAGALNAASTGVLLNRQTFAAVNVVNTDSLQITIDIDVD